MPREKAENHLLNSPATDLQATGATTISAMKTTRSVALLGLVLLSCLYGKSFLLQSLLVSLVLLNLCLYIYILKESSAFWRSDDLVIRELSFNGLNPCAEKYYRAVGCICLTN